MRRPIDRPGSALTGDNSAALLGRLGRERLGARSPVQDAGALQELVRRDVTASEAFSENALGVLFWRAFAEISQGQLAGAPQIEPSEHQSQDHEQEQEAAEERQHGYRVLLPAVGTVGDTW